LAHRHGEWFQQSLARLTAIPARRACAYKERGVYVVIGGAGGVGAVWSRYMVEHYQAQLIWLGRQPLNAAIEDKRHALGRLGPTPLYLVADATDRAALDRARRDILARYPHIQGVVHSAIVLQDQSLTQMDETAFRASLAAKVDISVNLDQVFGDLDLDFMLFFSSLQSFTKAAGQANYAAGCTFKDSFAQYLGQRRGYASTIVNWGYWGQVGVVTDAFYSRRMAQLGIDSLHEREAMESLDTLVSSERRQLGLIQTLNADALDHLGCREVISHYAGASPDPNLDPSPEQNLPVRAVLAEVNNTFGDRHSYFCALAGFLPVGLGDAIVRPKRLHVSPFQPVAGDYAVRFKIAGARIAIGIEHRHGRGGMIATLSGAVRPLNRGSAAALMVRRPLGALRVFGLIHWQAVKLAAKGAVFRRRPAPPEEEITGCPTPPF